MTCRNDFTNNEMGKQSPAANYSQVKKIVLSACSTIEKVGPSENSKLMLLGTRQKGLNSSTDIEATRMLAIGDSRLDPLLCPT